MPTVLDCFHGITDSNGLGEYGRFLTTSDGTTSTLVTSTLVNSTLAATELAGMTVLIETGACAGQVGHIQGGGLARGTGTLTVGDPFTSAILAGTSFSLYRLLPPLREGVKAGLLDILNEAVRDYLWVEDTVVVTGVTGQHYYTVDQATYPWWTDRRRIIEVRRPGATADTIPQPLNAAAWDWESVGETRKLVFPGAPFATGESAAVKVYRPANSRLKLNATARSTVALGAVTAVTVVLPGYYAATPTVALSGGGGTGATATATLSAGGVASVAVTAGGSGYTSPPVVSFTRDASDTGWANQSSQMAGVYGLSDELISDVTDVKTVCLWLAYQALAAQRAPGATVAEWLAKAELWGAKAATLEHVGEPSNLRTNVAAIRPALVGGWASSWAYGRRGY